MNSRRLILLTTAVLIILTFSSSMIAEEKGYRCLMPESRLQDREGRRRILAEFSKFYLKKARILAGAQSREGEELKAILERVLFQGDGTDKEATKKWMGFDGDEIGEKDVLLEVQGEIEEDILDGIYKLAVRKLTRDSPTCIVINDGEINITEQLGRQKRDGLLKVDFKFARLKKGYESYSIRKRDKLTIYIDRDFIDKSRLTENDKILVMAQLIHHEVVEQIEKRSHTNAVLAEFELEKGEYIYIPHVCEVILQNNIDLAWQGDKMALGYLKRLVDNTDMVVKEIRKKHENKLLSERGKEHLEEMAYQIKDFILDNLESPSGNFSPEVFLGKVPENPRMVKDGIPIDIKKLLANICRELLQDEVLGKEIETIYVIGSIAKGSASTVPEDPDKGGSDIDIFVRFKGLPEISDMQQAQTGGFYEFIGTLQQRLKKIGKSMDDRYSLYGISKVDIFSNAVFHQSIASGGELEDWKIARDINSNTDKVLLWGKVPKRGAPGLVSLYGVDVSRIPDNPGMIYGEEITPGAIKTTIVDIVERLLRSNLGPEIEEVYVYGGMVKGVGVIDPVNPGMSSPLVLYVRFKDLPVIGGREVPQYTGEDVERIGELRRALKRIRLITHYEDEGWKVKVLSNAVLHPTLTGAHRKVKDEYRRGARVEKTEGKVLVWKFRWTSRKGHEEYHRQGRFRRVIRDIATELSIKHDERTGEYDFRAFLKKRSGSLHRFTNVDGTETSIWIDKVDNLDILVIVDPRFDGNHAGRRRLSVYAQDLPMATHELTELKEWIKFAIVPKREVGLGLTIKGIRDGELNEWIEKDKRKARKKGKKSRAEKKQAEFHRKAKKAEMEIRTVLDKRLSKEEERDRRGLEEELIELTKDDLDITIAGIGVHPKPENPPENIGKGVNFEVSGDTITIRKDDGTVLASSGAETRRYIFRISRVLDILTRLKASKVLGDGLNLRLTIDIGLFTSGKREIKIFKGTKESHAAGAFAFMDAKNRHKEVLYIDEVICSNDMVIIHEILHLLLMNKWKDKTVAEIVQIIRDTGDMDNGLKERLITKVMTFDTDDKREAYLRHYYARYYLQEPKAGGYEGSDNERLTNDIRLNVVAGMLGITEERDLTEFRNVIDNLPDPNGTLTLRNRFLELVMKDGVIEEAEIGILLDNIGAVSKAIEGISGLSSGDMQEAIGGIGLYLSIKAIIEGDGVEVLPVCMQNLINALNIVDAKKKEAEEIMHRIRRMDLGIAMVFLDNLGTAQEEIQEVRRYLVTLDTARKRLRMGDEVQDGLTHTTNIQGVIDNYIAGKRDSLDIVSDILARWAIEAERSSIQDKVSEDTKGAIGLIMKRKGISVPDDTALSRIQRYDINVIEAQLQDASSIKDTIFHQHLSIYAKGNMDNRIIRIIVSLINNNCPQVFSFDNPEQAGVFKGLLKNKGIEAGDINIWEKEGKLVFIDVSQCSDYGSIREMIKGTLASRFKDLNMISILDSAIKGVEGNDKIILVRDSGIVDLYMMWAITLRYAAVGAELDGAFWTDIRRFLAVYYENNDTLVHEAMGIMKEKGGWILLLPEAAPFIRDYYEAIDLTRQLIQFSA